MIELKCRYWFPYTLHENVGTYVMPSVERSGRNTGGEEEEKWLDLFEPTAMNREGTDYNVSPS